MKYIKPKYAAVNAWSHLFISPWTVMLLLGALGHQLGIPYLFKFGYWETFCAILAIQLAWPNVVTEYETEDKDN